MQIVAIILSIILSIFSTAVMSYISMATPIGPWIASTTALIAMLLFKVLYRAQGVTQQITCVTAASSVGGILATALGFSFPTLYFLDQHLFNSWMANPMYFVAVVGSFALVAGWFGFWIANMIEHKCIVQEKLAFPIGQLVQKMIAAQNQVRKAWELCAGFLGTALFCIVQEGIGGITGIIPKTIVLLRPTTISVINLPLVPLDLWPLLWAIGFVTGAIIALPLAVGLMTKIIIVDPLNHLFFPEVSSIECMLAFCSGMVLAGALQGLVETPAQLWKVFAKRGSQKSDMRIHTVTQIKYFIAEAIPLLISVILFLTYFGFSPLAQLYLVIFSFICTYQIVIIAGKIGLAQLGRFATFVMVPALFLFNLDYVQIVFIATFVEISGGIAADILFGRKMAHMSHMSSAKIRKYQYLGLAVSVLTVGAVFWLLINHFKLGSPELFAYRAQGRQLLIGVQHFDYCILLIGVVFGVLLKYIKINPMLVLGGLLMPINISIGLMVGGFVSMCIRDREEWYPFWSGVFASNSLWMLLKAAL